MRLTEQVHHKLRQYIKHGDIVIDATTGNGHDTLFLVQCVGNQGHIFAFDVQRQALESAQHHLQKHDIQTPITWLHTGHENMLQHIPSHYHGYIKAITFNLGYLPKTNKQITTYSKTTIPALKQAISLLADNGIISILAYTGHSGGRKEAEAVKIWAAKLESCFAVTIDIPQTTRSSPPEWICIHKKS